MASFAEESGDELLAETGIERRRLAIGNVKFVRLNRSRPTPTESWRYICTTGSNFAKAAASSDETE